jgi:hypothetical protein
VLIDDASSDTEYFEVLKSNIQYSFGKVQNNEPFGNKNTYFRHKSGQKEYCYLLTLIVTLHQRIG